MGELIKPNFVVGSEKKFYDFISRLDDADKIVLISHTDLDGLAAARIIYEVVNPDEVLFVNYTEINLELVKRLKELQANKIIISDLYIKDKYLIDEIEKFSEICIIDHHQFSEDLNSDKTVFLNSRELSSSNNGFCATYLSYYLFSKIQTLEKFDWLVACASISDWLYFENASWIKVISKKYSGDFIIGDDGFIVKSGKFWDLQFKINLLIIYFKGDLRKAFDLLTNELIKDFSTVEKYSSEVQVYLDEVLGKFEKEKVESGDRIYFEFDPKFNVGSLVSNIVSGKIMDKTIIIGKNNGEIFSFSARRQDGGEDLNQLLINVVKNFENASGGGHFKAAGGHVQMKDKKKLLELFGFHNI